MTTEMILPHAVLVPDVHADLEHVTMPPLSPLALAADPALWGKERMQVEAEVVATYAPLYGMAFAKELLSRARDVRASLGDAAGFGPSLPGGGR